MADYLSNLVPFSASLPNMLWGKKKIGPTCWLFLIRRKGWVADKLAFLKSVCDLNSGLNLYSFIFFSSASSEQFHMQNVMHLYVIE